MTRSLGIALAAIFLVSPAVGQEASPVKQVEPERSVVLVRAETTCAGRRNQGSGVVVAPSLVATNAHVVQGSTHVSVHVVGKTWYATPELIVEDHDLCLLRVLGMPLAPAPLAAPESLAVGKPVVSIGFPGGQGPTRSRGKITGLWNYCGDRIIQSDAPTTYGSSGGGLFTEEGAWLGITTMVFPGTDSVNFALPAAWIQKLLETRKPESLGLIPCHSREVRLQDFLDRVRDNPSNFEAWEQMTRAWVKERPKDSDAWCALGHALHGKLLAEAQGRGEMDRKLLEESLGANRRALELTPGNSVAWNNLGVAHDMENRQDLAVKAFEHALELRPDYGLAWLNLGAARFNQRDYSRAIQALRRGLELKPDESMAWARLAFCEARLKRWEDALHHYRIALRWNPMNALWWQEFGEACHDAGDAKGYAESLERLERLNPGLAKELGAYAKKHRIN